MDLHEVKITRASPAEPLPKINRDVTLNSLEDLQERKSGTIDKKEQETSIGSDSKSISSSSNGFDVNNQEQSNQNEAEIEMVENKSIRSSYQRVGRIKLAPPPPSQKQHAGFLRFDAREDSDKSERGMRTEEEEESERGSEKLDFPPSTPTSPKLGKPDFGNLLRQLKTQDLYGVESARKRLRSRAKHLRTLDHVQSLITLLQCFVIALTGSLAAAICEMAWIEGGYKEFAPNEWSTFLQSLIMLCSVASLVIFYIETRVEVIMNFPTRKWLWPWYFPNFMNAFFEMVLYGLHCPPMLFNVPLIVCTSLRLIFLFRLCKFHPDVRSIRFNQIMTGECPTFSTFFFYKTIVRTSPVTAIVGLAVISTPMLTFLYLQTSRLDEAFIFEQEVALEVFWKIVWFIIAQQSPDALPTARVAAVLAAIVSMALSTMIFTGLLGSLEMDSAQSAQYELIYRKQVLEDVRNLAAKTIQTAFRYSRSRTSKGKKIMKKTVRSFRAKLNTHLELREKDRGGGSVIHSVSHLISITEELAQKMDRLKGVVEGKHAALYNLDTNLHSQTIANLARHFEGMIAKQEEAAARQERAQNAAALTLSALQRDLHDAAVENMRGIEVRQAEFQRVNSTEQNRVIEQLAKLTAEITASRQEQAREFAQQLQLIKQELQISQAASRQEQAREFYQQLQTLKQELQTLQVAALKDAVLKLHAAQYKRSEELHNALQASTQFMLQNSPSSAPALGTFPLSPAHASSIPLPLSPARSSSIPLPPPSPL